MSDPQVLVVLVTAPDPATAQELGEALVGERLAACVNVVPGATSIYRWEDEVQRDNETLMIIKVPTGAFEALRSRVVELHPYDTPEVLALDVRAGEPAYLKWVLDSVGGPS